MSTALVRTTDGNVVVPLEALSEALSDMQPEVLLPLIRRVAVTGNLDILRDVVDAVELETGTSIFDNPDNLEILKGVAPRHTLRDWLTATGADPSRDALAAYWDQFMVQAAVAGVQMGNISAQTGGGLWKATKQLASAMIEDPASYGYLPALRINHPVLVQQVLERINDPARWLEVLIGDSIDQISKSHPLLGALRLRDDHAGLSGALYGVGVCLLK